MRSHRIDTRSALRSQTPEIQRVAKLELPHVGGGHMKILCTHGLKSVMLALATELERRSTKPLAMTWGSTLDLVRDIQGGACGDIAVLTAQAIDELAAHGKAVAGSRVDLARSAIGLAVRRGAKKP